MMSPDAGGTDEITQNRGYVAIPEVGDQVMVNFVHNHPDRPFVMGGMFHGGTGLGGGADNRVKSIQTRSGHRIVFTEDESIIITDKSGNEIHLDTTGSNINITAPETMTFTSKNMNFIVTENINTTAGMNISTTAGINISEGAGANHAITAGGTMVQNAILDYSLMAANITQFAKKEFMSQSEILTKTSGKIQAMATKGNITFNAKSTIKDDSGEKSNSH